MPPPKWTLKFTPAAPAARHPTLAESDGEERDDSERGVPPVARQGRGRLGGRLDRHETDEDDSATDDDRRAPQAPPGSADSDSDVGHRGHAKPKAKRSFSLSRSSSGHTSAERRHYRPFSDDEDGQSDTSDREGASKKLFRPSLTDSKRVTCVRFVLVACCCAFRRYIVCLCLPHSLTAWAGPGSPKGRVLIKPPPCCPSR